MKIIFVWLLAIVFLIDSVLRAIRSSFNLGVLFKSTRPFFVFRPMLPAPPPRTARRYAGCAR